MSIESILERNRKRAQENDEKLGATKLGTSALNYSTQKSLEQAAREMVPTGYQLAEANRQTMNDRAFSIPNAVSAFSKDGVSSRGGGFSGKQSNPNYFSYAERREQWENELRAAQAEKSRLEAGLALDQVGPVQTEIDRLKGLLRYSDKHYDDTFFGQFQANYAQGRLSQDEAYAWNAYKTSDEAAQNAMDASLALYTFQKGNQEALDDDATLPWISQSLAGYLPQFVDQKKAQIGGGLAGAAAGSLLPVIGTATGASAGAISASGLYSYNTMSGAAFKGLVDNGVDINTTRALSQDEAVIDALIEMADTGLDIATLGVGNLISAAAKGSLGAIAKGGAKGAAKNLVNAVRKYGNNALVRYGLNVGGEALEEAAQEAVSIANQERAARGEDEGLWDLVRATGDVAVQDVILGRNPQNRAQIAQAAAEGAKIAAMMGGATMLGTTLANRALGGTSQSSQTAESRTALQRKAGDAIDSAYAAMLANGMFSQEARQAMDQAGRTMSFDNGKSVQRTTAAPTSVQAQEASMPAVFSQEESNPAMEAHNRSSLSRAAEAFGQQGKQIVRSFYDGQTSPAEYYGAFASYYQAGVNGTDINKVKSSYKSALNEPQRQAAYLAGQMDAAASLASEKSAVQYATVYGEESGFVPNEYSKGIDRKTTELYQAIGQATGTKITIAPATGAGGANGWYQNGTVYIAQDAENTGFVVAKHEITHRLQEIAPEQYRQYRDYAVSALSQGSGSLVEQYRARYAQSGVNLTEEQAMDEIAADFTEALFTDQEKFSRMVQNNRSVARKVLDAVRDFIRKVKKALGLNRADQASRETFGVGLATLERAEKLWESALKEGTEVTLRTGGQNGKIDTRKNSMKEGTGYGKAREETREDFLRRSIQEGFEVVEGEGTAYGFRRVGQPHDGGHRGEITQEAQDTQRELTALGVSADIVDGPILRNRNGLTDIKEVEQAVTVARSYIFISKNTTLLPRNIAGHEAFHLWKSGIGREAYIERLEENLDFSGDAFRAYQSDIALTVFGQEPDLTDETMMERFAEELYAYISGDIHEGTNEAIILPMFRDFDAVREAWERLVEENRGGTTRSRYALKEDGANGRERVQQEDEGILREDDARAEEEDRGRDPGDGEVRSIPIGERYRGVDPTYGENPVRTWVSDGLVTPEPGSLAESEQQTAVEYGIPSFVVSDAVWDQNKGGTPAFSAEGQIYLRENLPEAGRGTYVSHEATHVMKQVGYQPYLDFTQRVPDMLDLSSTEAHMLLNGVGKHRGIDPLNMTEEQAGILFDEVNATIYGSIAAGDEVSLDYARPAFQNFDAYAVELTQIHEQFKRERGGTQARESRKGSRILQENAALQEENALLRERVEYWKGQTKRTQRVTTDKKSVTRAAQTAEGKLTAALKAGAERAGTLRERQGDGTMESRYSLKEDGANGADGKKDSSRKEPDQKKRFVDFMQKLKDEGKLSEYFRETDRLAEEQDPDQDWDVLLK